MPQEDFTVTGTASENFLETVVKHFVLLSKNKRLGWCPVLLWKTVAVCALSVGELLRIVACFTVGSSLLEMRCLSPSVRC